MPTCHLPRQVFVQMVEAACREGTPQCFMFTPKLLPDLPYTRDVYPMSIFNGVLAEPLTDNFQEVRAPNTPKTDVKTCGSCRVVQGNARNPPVRMQCPSAMAC